MEANLLSREVETFSIKSNKAVVDLLQLKPYLLSFKMLFLSMKFNDCFKVVFQLFL